MRYAWFADIYKNYYHSLKATLIKRGASEENAEDVINNTAISLLKRDDLKQEGAIALFTKSVQLNLYHIGRYDRPTTTSFEIGHYHTPEVSYMQKQDVLTFYRCLEYVPPKATEALVLKLDGISHQNTKGNCKHALKVLHSKMKLNNVQIKETVAYATKGSK